MSRLWPKTCDLLGSLAGSCTSSTAKTEWDLGVRIKKEISQGNPVVIEGCPFTPVKLEAEDLKKKLLLYKNRKVDAHDTLLRAEDPGNPYKAMSLGDFCKGVEDESRIQCILDCPSTDHAKPSFIYIDDGISTLGVLHMEPLDRHFIPIDMLNLSSWFLPHQPLSHTYAHHDANGYCTWTQVLSGHKGCLSKGHQGLPRLPHMKTTLVPNVQTKVSTARSPTGLSFTLPQATSSSSHRAPLTRYTHQHCRSLWVATT
ncbi:hypothetical protein B0H34DRAFT_495615 [Crassisporium funariophilum]|nr:hypothetical protein B0H34DRAFT_495615 [Crassisporium funariophilum]